MAGQKNWCLHSCLLLQRCGSNGPNNKHNLEEHWHVGSTTSTVASLRVARLGWLPRQAKLPLHDGWYRNRQICQRPSNVKSTIRKARSSPTQTWIALGKLLATYNFSASHFLHYMISILRTVLEPASRWLSHWPWNVKSTMVATYNFAASPVLHYIISTQDHFRPC